MKALPAFLSVASLACALGLALALPDSHLIELDRNGKRGPVTFDHATHQARVHPGPDAPFPASPEAACAGCHHSTDRLGVIQLWPCASCHRESGNPDNPRNADFDELWSERAFHDQCIGCHQASRSGPVTCGECHRSTVP